MKKIWLLLLVVFSSANAGENTVLVTGSTGFIGAHVVRRLLLEGYEVRAFARPENDLQSLKELTQDSRLQIFRGDITDPYALARAAQGVRYVVHAAAHVADFGSPEVFERVNIMGSLRLMSAIAATHSESQPCRVVHLSTSDVHGFELGKQITEQSELLESGYPYTDTKIRGEQMVRDFHGEKGVSVAVLRPTWVYGPGDKVFFPELIHAIRTHFFAFFGDRNYHLAMVYVENLVDAILLAMTKQEAAGQAYLVTDGSLPWKDLVAALQEGFNLPKRVPTAPIFCARAVAATMEGVTALLRLKTRPPLSRFTVDLMGSNMSFSNEKIRRELGYSPAVSISDGIPKTIEWFQSQKTIGRKVFK